MKAGIVVAVALASVFAAREPGSAGVVDSPLPAPFTQHVFTVPGIIDYVSPSSFYACTNLDSASVTIGVELFGSAGGGPINDASATSLNVAVGATVLFGTPAAGLLIDANVGTNGFGKGSARILSTSKKIACTAFVADTTNAPPTSAWQLTIIKKTKQKASN